MKSQCYGGQQTTQWVWWLLTFFCCSQWEVLSSTDQYQCIFHMSACSRFLHGTNSAHSSQHSFAPHTCFPASHLGVACQYRLCWHCRALLQYGPLTSALLTHVLTPGALVSHSKPPLLTPVGLQASCSRPDARSDNLRRAETPARRSRCGLRLLYRCLRVHGTRSALAHQSTPWFG